MRRAEAQALWDKASTLADAAMKQLEAQGVVERVVLPDTDDDLAKKALHEAFKLALGPGNAMDRSAAARLVLTYTKPRPPTVAETQGLLADNGDGEALIGCLLIPTHRSCIVVRHTPAILVHEPEIVLSIGVALIGEGPPQSHRGRIVAAPVRGQPILERCSGDGSGEAQRQNNGRNPDPDFVSHGAPR